MNKKIFILLIALTPFLFGCTVNYEMVIYDQTVSENITLKEKYSTSISNDVDKELTYNTISKNSQTFDTYANEKIKGLSYYKKQKYEENDEIGVTYLYDFSTKDIYDSYAINSCYDRFTSMIDGDYFILSTDKKNKCFLNDSLDEIKVHIKTNHKMKENNADYVDGYNYYWVINKANHDNKNIYLMLYNNKYVFNYEGEAIPYIIVSVIVAILSVIVIIVLKRKSRKNNNV